jgi:hypothetical protein
MVPGLASIGAHVPSIWPPSRSATNRCGGHDAAFATSDDGMTPRMVRHLSDDLISAFVWHAGSLVGPRKAVSVSGKVSRTGRHRSVDPERR